MDFKKGSGRWLRSVMLLFGVYMTTCQFCQIIATPEKAFVVFEDLASIAFLDRRPLFPGHCLLVPRTHYETLAGVPAGELGPLFTNAQMLSQAVEGALEAEGTFVAINNRVSQSVPHLHIHIVPRRRGDGLRGFFWPRNPYRDREHMREVQLQLQRSVARISGC